MYSPKWVGRGSPSEDEEMNYLLNSKTEELVIKGFTNHLPLSKITVQTISVMEAREGKSGLPSFGMGLGGSLEHENGTL